MALPPGAVTLPAPLASDIAGITSGQVRAVGVVRSGDGDSREGSGDEEGELHVVLLRECVRETVVDVRGG